MAPSASATDRYCPMNTASRPLAPVVPMPRSVVAGGLLAGTLDLAYICTFWGVQGVGPVRILHSVAAGWMGREAALAGGLPSALLGLASHYGIAIAMAWTYYAVARHWRALARHPWRFGPLYGLVLYAVMTYVVVPLSAAGDGRMPAWRWINLSHIAVHMWLVGTTCALAARRALRGAMPG